MNDLDSENFSIAMLVVTKIQEKYGINSANFARIIGKNPTYVNDVKKGKTRRISEEIADKIIEQWPELSKIWILTGEGEMLRSDSTPAQPASAAPADAEELAMLRKNNAAHLKHIELLEEKVSSLEEQLRQEREKVSSSSARMSEERILQ